MGITSNAGEDPSKSAVMGTPPIPDILYDVLDMTADPTPDDDIFHDPTPGNAVFHSISSDSSDMDGLYYFDPSNIDHVTGFVGCAFHLTLDPDDAIDSHDADRFLFTLDYYDELQGAHEEFDSFAYVSHAAIQDCAHMYVEYLGY